MMFQLSFVFALSIAVAAPAIAQADPNFEACANKSGADQIAGCTAMIDSRKLNDKDRAGAFAIRGSDYLHQKDYVRSISDFDHAIRLEPRQSMTFVGRGAAYLMKNDLARGIADFDEAIRLDPHNSVAFNNRGWAYYLRKDYVRAVADYDVAIALDPQFAQALYVRGLAKGKLGQNAQGKADISRAIAIDPNIVTEMAKAMGAGG